MHPTRSFYPINRLSRPNFSIHISTEINHSYDLMPISNPMPTSSLKYEHYDFMPIKTSNQKTFQVYTMYKRVDKKVRPVPAQFPEDCQIWCTIPEDPLLTLKPLPFDPPEFEPTTKITLERMKILNVNAKRFLSLEEENYSNTLW